MKIDMLYKTMFYHIQVILRKCKISLQILLVKTQVVKMLLLSTSNFCKMIILGFQDALSNNMSLFLI